MLEIYLSRNTSRNQKLQSFCDSHGISYSDCFELLVPSFQRFKRHREMTLSELITLVLRKPDQNLRLPLVVSQQKVYPDLTLDEARTFLPRTHKVVSFRECLYKQLTD